MYMVESGVYYMPQRYLVNDDGMIAKFNPNIPYERHDFSESWKAVGIHEILPFGNIGRCIPLQEAATTIKRFTYKNRDGKYLLQDFDHGTTRLWGSRVLKVYQITR